MWQNCTPVGVLQRPQHRSRPWMARLQRRKRPGDRGRALPVAQPQQHVKEALQ